MMSLAVEDELVSGFQNAKKVCSLRQTLNDMGYMQPTTPIQMKNSTAEGIVNRTINIKR